MRGEPTIGDGPTFTCRRRRALGGAAAKSSPVDERELILHVCMLLHAVEVSWLVLDLGGPCASLMRDPFARATVQCKAVPARAGGVHWTNAGGRENEWDDVAQ